MSPLDASLAELSPALLLELLDGNERQRRHLATLLLEHFDVSVFYALRNHPAALPRKDDFVSELMLYLYREDAKILRRWDPGRAGLKGYLNMIAGRFVRRGLATRPTPVALVEETLGSPYLPSADQELEMAYRVALSQLHDHLRDHGSVKDRSRFRALFIQGRSPAQVAKDEGASVEALHTWASRLKRRLQQAFPQIAKFFDGSDDER